MEAMAVGRPVIATDNPGCRDLVENGVTGFLVQPRNVGELAEAMERLIENPLTGAMLGHRARQYAEGRFSAAVANRHVLKAVNMSFNTPLGGIL